jgi:uncharacterized protein (TIGR02145 family)
MIFNFINKKHLKKLFLLLSMAFLFVSCNENELPSDNDFAGDKGTFVDERDGNTYKWVRIGDQIWMAENLAYLPSFGDELTLYYVLGYSGNNIEEAKNTEEYREYGVFYNYYAANEASPDGWHLPSNAEWERLAEFISEDNGGFEKQEDKNSQLGDWYEVGKQLKIITSVYETNGTDNYGFSALLPGIVEANGEVTYEGKYGRFWTATEENTGRAYARYVEATTTIFYATKYWKTRVLNVRCIKD